MKPETRAAGETLARQRLPAGGLGSGTGQSWGGSGRGGWPGLRQRVPSRHPCPNTRSMMLPRGRMREGGIRAWRGGGTAGQMPSQAGASIPRVIPCPAWALADGGVSDSPGHLDCCSLCPDDPLALSELGVLSVCEPPISMSGTKAPGQRTSHGHAPHLTAPSVSWALGRKRAAGTEQGQLLPLRPLQNPRVGGGAGGRRQEQIAFLRVFTICLLSLPFCAVPSFCCLALPRPLRS